MSPLFMAVLKAMLEGREIIALESADVLAPLGGVACFDVTLAFDAITALAESLCEHGRIELAFLPAPRTWIEWRYDDGVRVGVLLSSDDNRVADLQWVKKNEKESRFGLSDGHCFIPLRETPFQYHTTEGVRWISSGETDAQRRGWYWFLVAALACINTPRVMGRTQHQPHRALQRRLLASRKPIGRFPLRAWTELTLSCTVHSDEGAQGDAQRHLTGAKCLHFVRSFIRVRNGHLELVKAHWRGDASLGIKRSRYRVVP